MIKLTNVESINRDAPALILIPGGPGLSSSTLRSMDILSRSFNLFYVDFPGVNGTPYEGDKSFDELCSALESELLKINGTKFVLGHSFGGFFAANLSLKMKVEGVICLATPFTEKSLEVASENYTANKSQELSRAEEEWEKLQDDKSLAKWFSEYGKLYFVRPEGKEILLKDKVSAKFFLANRADAANIEPMLSLLKRDKTKKIFIAGKQDEMLPEAILKNDAELGGFNFVSVKDASHFVSFDQPEFVAGLIEDFMRQNH
ncbi:MAG: alpha/beta hydrolase [Bacteriovoracaceae bacterium]|nr:alpha/beta hydrolase [Bacteriovoracaceae bacterium]